MKENKKWTVNDKLKWSRVWLGFVIVLIIGGIATAYFTRGDYQTDYIDRLASIDYQSLKDLYPLALKKALAWNKDASLESVSIAISQTAIFSGFTFQNESDPSIVLNVYILEDDLVLKIDSEEIENLFHKNNPISIVPDELFYDSFDVLDIALAAGGREFLLNHPTSKIDIQLQSDYNWKPGIVLWRVYFSDFPEGRMDIFVHPDTGEVLKVEEIGP